MICDQCKRLRIETARRWNAYAMQRRLARGLNRSHLDYRLRAAELLEVYNDAVDRPKSHMTMHRHYNRA
jgi:hypothetical protein